MRRRIVFGTAIGLLCALAQAQAQPQAADSPMANADSSAPQGAQRLEGAALLSALRAGGKVVYFRHTATDFVKNDAAMRSFDDCANQRLLSAQGRADAKRIGEQIRALKIPVTDVFASPMCRTMDHATLAFDRATPKLEMRESDGGDYPGVKRLLAAPVPAGSNRWLVGHGTPFRAVAGAPHLAEGEAAVLQPLGTGWTVLARLAPDDWKALGAAR